MRNSRILLLALLTAGISGAFYAELRSSEEPPRAMDLAEMSHALADLAAEVEQGTVALSVNRRRGTGQGSGFVVDAIRGIVVTNAHVVGDRPTAIVTFHDRREVTGRVLGTDPQTDLAVLDIPPGSARHQLAWGDSDELRPGSLVMAIGSPLGLKGTTSLGVISALGRSLGLVEDAYEDFMQFDAFIDQGSSGGPLVNMHGQVVGINTAIAGGPGGPAWRGIGYAIPSALARRLVEDLSEHGEVRRGWLGVTVHKVEPSDARNLGMDRPYGARITSVVPGGPADQSGLRVDDVILAIEGREIEDEDQVKARIGALEPGSSVRIKVLSARAIRTIRVELGERQDLDDTGR